MPARWPFFAKRLSPRVLPRVCVIDRPRIDGHGWTTVESNLRMNIQMRSGSLLMSSPGYVPLTDHMGFANYKVVAPGVQAPDDPGGFAIRPKDRITTDEGDVYYVESVRDAAGAHIMLQCDLQVPPGVERFKGIESGRYGARTGRA